jgi:hypothetical protein
MSAAAGRAPDSAAPATLPRSLARAAAAAPRDRPRRPRRRGAELEGEGELRLCADGRSAMAAYQASCAKQAILWGGVAVGALLMGSPVDAVAK